MSDCPMIHSSAAEATTMKGIKRTVISKLIRARLKRNMVELFLREVGWLRVYTHMKRLIIRERMRIIVVKTAINGPTNSSFRHHSTVEICGLFVSVTGESVLEFIVIDTQNVTHRIAMATMVPFYFLQRYTHLISAQRLGSNDNYYILCGF